MRETTELLVCGVTTEERVNTTPRTNDRPFFFIGLSTLPLFVNLIPCAAIIKSASELH